jgi:hypothetical protein
MKKVQPAIGDVVAAFSNQSNPIALGRPWSNVLRRVPRGLGAGSSLKI